MASLLVRSKMALCAARHAKRGLQSAADRLSKLGGTVFTEFTVGQLRHALKLQPTSFTDWFLLIQELANQHKAMNMGQGFPGAHNCSPTGAQCAVWQTLKRPSL